MTPSEYLIEMLKNYDGCDITDVYIFDHGRQDEIDGDIIYGIQIGDKWWYEGRAFESYLKELGGAFALSDPNIHFRNCFAGGKDENDERSFLKYLANKTGHNVTAGACPGSYT